MGRTLPASRGVVVIGGFSEGRSSPGEGALAVEIVRSMLPFAAACVYGAGRSEPSFLGRRLTRAARATKRLPVLHEAVADTVNGLYDSSREPGGEKAVPQAAYRVV